MSKRKTTKEKGFSSTSFERTCDKEYDRHVYEVVLKDGRKVEFDNYEIVRAFWHQHCSSGLLSHVNVI